jgi:hypothetical protein
MKRRPWRSVGLFVALAWLCAIVPGAGPGRDEPNGYPLTPISGSDGAFEVVDVGGKPAWRSAEAGGGRFPRHLYFRVPDGLPPWEGPAYVQVEYVDRGTGRLALRYNARPPGGDYRTAARGYGRELGDTGEIRTAVFELPEPGFRHAQNLGADLRLAHPDGSAPLEVVRATLHARPTPLFVERSARPWLRPYSGPSRADVDATTLRGKVLCGYQGWFRCPGDGTEQGWVHWSRNSARLAPATLTVEMWPDMAEWADAGSYHAPGFTYPDGRPARLFSSADPRTVDRHFEWMRQYGIDGVLVQRFVVGLNDPAEASRVLAYARDAANRTGRVFAVEYDLSGTPPDRMVERLERDWRWLVEELRITADPRYLHHDGRPVLAIFGFYPDRFDARLAHRILDLFQADGKLRAAIIGGCPWSWRSAADPEWARAFRRFDAIKPWNVGNVVRRDGRRFASTGGWAQDLAEARRAGRLLMPVLYPGFGWDNLKRRAPGTTAIPRLGGEFFWDQFAAARRLGLDTAFVAMFDEVDEGTAIFKVTNTPPTQAHFATYEGLPSDWYLRLTGEGTRLLRGERADLEMPARPGRAPSP